VNEFISKLLVKEGFFSLVLSFGEVRSQYKEENFVLAKSGFVFRNEILNTNYFYKEKKKQQNN